MSPARTAVALTVLGLGLVVPALPGLSLAAAGEAAMCDGRVVTIDLNDPAAPDPFRDESDVVLGTPDDDVISTGGGDDTVCGGDGADEISLNGAPEGQQEEAFGEGGNDTLLDSGANEFLDGGSGRDKLSFFYHDLGLMADLMLTGPQDTGDGGVDELMNLEDIVGGYGDDILSGTDDANYIDGQEGDDTIDGRDGNDYLIGYVGNETLVGGGGDDHILGEWDTDTADGGPGDDYIELGGDTNLIEKAYGGAGRDFFQGGTGDDLFDGGDGRDTVQFDAFLCRGCSGNPGVFDRVKIDLRLTDPQDTFGAGTDQLLSIESVVGSHFDDVLLGNGANNRLSGDKGNDVLRGRRGADFLSGGRNRDRCIGGPGHDDYEYCE